MRIRRVQGVLAGAPEELDVRWRIIDLVIKSLADRGLIVTLLRPYDA